MAGEDARVDLGQGHVECGSVTGASSGTADPDAAALEDDDAHGR